MTSDLVERLRFRADENYEMLANIHEPLLEAAARIEQLEAALRYNEMLANIHEPLLEAAARIEQLEAALRYIAWGQKEGDEPRLIARAVLLGGKL